MSVAVRPYRPDRERAWAEALLDRHFGGPVQARRGELIDVASLPGLVAERDGAPAGLLTYRVEGEECELAVLVAAEQGAGVGTALVASLRSSVAGRCARVWVVTTNDNLRALRFYQRRGFVLRALRAGAVDGARRSLKPGIPRIGDHGIPLRDELELEMDLTAGGDQATS